MQLKLLGVVLIGDYLLIDMKLQAVLVTYQFYFSRSCHGKALKPAPYARPLPCSGVSWDFVCSVMADYVPGRHRKASCFSTHSAACHE
jgi:hypothetical protein